MSESKNKFEASIIHELKTKFNNAPKIEKVELLTPVQVIQKMTAEIKEMQKKGYTLAMILDILKESGVSVGLSTLKKVMKESEAPKPEKRPSSPRSKAKNEQLDLLKKATEEAIKEPPKSTEEPKIESGQIEVKARKY